MSPLSCGLIPRGHWQHSAAARGLETCLCCCYWSAATGQGPGFWGGARDAAGLLPSAGLQCGGCTLTHPQPLGLLGLWAQPAAAVGLSLFSSTLPLLRVPVSPPLRAWCVDHLVCRAGEPLLGSGQCTLSRSRGRRKPFCEGCGVTFLGAVAGRWQVTPASPLR